jgi:hypothetical protein
VNARTCIICGGRTGSREHIFPAALGGRRTNRGIYCDAHNNAYSGLADIISQQLAFFNAWLGVVGDHADGPTSVTMTDVASGRELELSGGEVRFKDPLFLSETSADGQTTVALGFSSWKDATEWVRQQKKKGVDVRFTGEQLKRRYQAGTMHKGVLLGGTEEGLRAIGYIAQTFLAHEFPDEARLPAFQGIKDYTLKNIGADFVWWDFDPSTHLPPNAFPFGHRVIVGFDSVNGTAYARISLFSALNFAILLGNLTCGMSRAVIIDIDPLAMSPPKEIVKSKQDGAAGTVRRLDTATAGLAEAIRTGCAQTQIDELMRRITEFRQQKEMDAILDRIGDVATLPDAERDALFANIVAAEAQRILNLMDHVAADCKRRASNPAEHALAAFLQQCVVRDPMAVHGLSEEADRALAIASEALAKQMSADCKAGRLDRERLAMLIGGGPGAYLVAAALTEKFALQFPE